MNPIPLIAIALTLGLSGCTSLAYTAFSPASPSVAGAHLRNSPNDENPGTVGQRYAHDEDGNPVDVGNNI